MTTMTGDSIRLRILNAIKDAAKAIDVPDTTDPNYVAGPADWPLKFSTVALGPLGDEDNRKRYSLGIVPGPEKHSHLFPFIVCDQQIGLEFRATKNKGDDDPLVMAEHLMTVVKRLALKDKQWTGLAIDTELVNNEIDLVSFGDRSIVGVLFIVVKYRHSQFDPRDPDASII
ncbi:hypothetical protein [Hyphomicrobium sp.]|uniref:hypothetical protein n=1 Tax=Hyphomicrobium sp. TaxID=82 RepID=UPI001D60DF27|nr:hypothetical protein [Hyphomicrobium sp.]MBY0560004.1 hypothetical protein [Hyphomicrobium sp.]